MKPNRWWGRWTIAVLLVWVGSTTVAWGNYDRLEAQLRRDQSPDTKLRKSLPEPDTPREHWLYGRIVERPAEAKIHLETAATRAEDAGRQLRYLHDWIRVSLLLGPDTSDLEVLERVLDPRIGRESGGGEVWLAAARIARAVGDTSRARPYYKQALTDEESAPRAMLGLAELSLEDGDLQRAREHLDEYLLRYPDRRRAEFWLVKGRYFEKQGADSEAYVAYSHIINQYPDSMVLPRAEERIENIPLPEPLVASNNAVEDTPDPRSVVEEQNGPSLRGTGRYRIQAGSFRSRQRARRLRGKLRSEFNRRIRIQPARVDGTRYYRVYLVGFAEKQAAESTLRQLKARGYRGFIKGGASH